ncbi:integrase [Mycobacterium avium]|uniref:integrase n=1 Tax=Mycobacterium avium TaxID=1764 RepID=UPI001CDAAE6C|nr:integrase [Mycobacterium avium]MCA2337895.1 site-specific integrase [Mycobacterium avium]
MTHYLTAAEAPLVNPDPGDRVLATVPGLADGGLDRPLFGDPEWDITAAALRPTGVSHTLRFADAPETFQSALRRIAWATINLDTPDVLAHKARTNHQLRPAPSSVKYYLTTWKQFCRWLDQRGITSLAAVTTDDLADYAQHLRQRPIRQSSKALQLTQISRIWALAPLLPPDDRLPMPPWETDDIDALLGPPETFNENATPPIHPLTMSPLLIWALRTIQGFGPDIISGYQEYLAIVERARTATQPRGAASDILRDYAETMRVSGQPLPGNIRHNKGAGPGAPTIAATYIAATLGIPEHAVRGQRRSGVLEGLRIGTSAPLDVPITGAVDGRPWTSAIAFHEADLLMSRLAAACLIVIAYLSGMRADEVLSLRRGCCPPPVESANGSLRHLIYGTHYKGVKDADGNRKRDGETRSEPWVVVEPVAQAVSTLEAITDSQQLFPSSADWVLGSNGVSRRTGAALSAPGANGRIRAFIAWANELAASHGRTHELIPTDPAAAVTIRRFRRTVAWFIARQPGGRVALGVQYGHVALRVSEGYSGRAASGWHNIFAMEEARALADRLNETAERLRDGEGVSGPAAGRLIHAANHYQHHFGGQFLTTRQYRTLTNDPTLQIHDNETQMLTCVFDGSKAMCLTPSETPADRRQRGPSVDRCKATCGNIARTDSQVAALRGRMKQLQNAADDPLQPLPLRHRLRLQADAHRGLIEAHQRTRHTTTPDEDAHE